jgi:hypothetical protein
MRILHSPHHNRAMGRERDEQISLDLSRLLPWAIPRRLNQNQLPQM